MKSLKHLYITMAAVITTAVFISCSVDYPDAPGGGYDSGNADFTKYVSVGNSLTAGVQNGGLRDTFQFNSYPRMIARQLGFDDNEFTYNPFPDSGTAGSMFFGNPPFSATTGSPNLISSVISTTPTGTGQATPFENLGVPTAFLYDFLNATSNTNCWQATRLGNTGNTLFNAIVRGNTQFQNLKTLAPSFITFHLGNNDILGYATNGAGLDGNFQAIVGVPPYTPVNDNDPLAAALNGDFEDLYVQAIDSLLTLNADLVLVNIPNVTSIAYFTAIKKDSLVVNLNPLTKYKIYTTETSVQYVTLAASKYFGRTDFGAGAPAPYGIHPSNPLGGNFTLTTAEVTNITNIVNGYNAVIDSVAEHHNLPVVDVHGLLKQIADVSGSAGAGYPIGSGIKVKIDYITGGIFSLDGVHPSTLGYAIIANEIIKTTNSHYHSSVPLINLNQYMEH